MARTFAPIAGIAFAVLVGPRCLAANGCPPAGYSVSQLDALKSANFKLEDAKARNALALAVLPCLGSIDPNLRDGIAFEGLSTWMRSKQLSAGTATRIFGELAPWLSETHPDPEGVAKPFAALVLAEVARMDRIDPFLQSDQRRKLVAVGADYLESVDDYRGFETGSGWRHAVAHTADLFMQLALNPQVGKPDLDRLLAAIEKQVVPSGDHFYIYGEGVRMARPVVFIAQRGLHSAEEWSAWLSKVCSPVPFKEWREVYGSQAGLAKRHNTLAFVNAMYAFVQESGNAELKAKLLPPLVAALQQLL